MPLEDFATNFSIASSSTPFVPDGKCDIKDIVVVAKCFGSVSGTLRWNANCDVDNDDEMHIRNVSLLAKHFEQADP
jgi:hypothetical protein